MMGKSPPAELYAAEQITTYRNIDTDYPFEVYI